MSRMDSNPRSAFTKLLAYCSSNEWAGYDPYDALNSKLFESSPLAKSKSARLALTQMLKRAPISARGLLQVPKTQNAKAIALFLMALLKSPGLCNGADSNLVSQLAERLAALRSPGSSYWCWGYSFPWQTRSVLVPRGAPNLVCTTFAAEASLSLYEQRHAPEYLEMAASAAEYIVKELYWSGRGSVAGFGYPLPTVQNQVHNANFLAAALLSRVYKHTGDSRLLDPALKAARYSAARQRSDGSWLYGEGPSQMWIDNFHTGFNLCALRQISRALPTNEFDPCMQQGLRFYREHFFLKNGETKYFHDRRYPIDIHCVAQAIITLLEFRDMEPENIQMARSVFKWAMTNMWDERGFYYYRVYRAGTVRTSYMRWSQAWMLLALSELVNTMDAPGQQC
jgi:hypothetical protein